MADLKSEKEVWMNKLRQTKEYKIDPVQQVLAQQIEELAEKDLQEGIKEMVDKQRQTDLNGDHGEQSPLDPIEQAKELIINKIVKHFDDVIFEMVAEEMSNHYVFQSQNYLTEAGFELFEDEYFEFYHEHHGDILYQVRQFVYEDAN